MLGSLCNVSASFGFAPSSPSTASIISLCLAPSIVLDASTLHSAIPALCTIMILPLNHCVSFLHPPQTHHHHYVYNSCTWYNNNPASIPWCELSSASSQTDHNHYHYIYNSCTLYNNDPASKPWCELSSPTSQTDHYH